MSVAFLTLDQKLAGDNPGGETEMKANFWDTQLERVRKAALTLGKSIGLTPEVGWAPYQPDVAFVRFPGHESFGVEVDELLASDKELVLVMAYRLYAEFKAGGETEMPYIAHKTEKGEWVGVHDGIEAPIPGDHSIGYKHHHYKTFLSNFIEDKDGAVVAAFATREEAEFYRDAKRVAAEYAAAKAEWAKMIHTEHPREQLLTAMIPVSDTVLIFGSNGAIHELPASPAVQKPPLGVLPLYLWKEANPSPTPEDVRTRHLEVLAAIGRYLDAGLPVPGKWEVEFTGSIGSSKTNGELDLNKVSAAIHSSRRRMLVGRRFSQDEAANIAKIAAASDGAAVVIAAQAKPDCEPIFMSDVSDPNNYDYSAPMALGEETPACTDHWVNPFSGKCTTCGRAE